MSLGFFFFWFKKSKKNVLCPYKNTFRKYFLVLKKFFVSKTPISTFVVRKKTMHFIFKCGRLFNIMFYFFKAILLRSPFFKFTKKKNEEK